jgi:hypothetical protein
VRVKKTTRAAPIASKAGDKVRLGTIFVCTVCVCVCVCKSCGRVGQVSGGR